MPTHYEIPRLPRSDYILNRPSFFSLVVPEEAINLVYDPEMTAFAAGNTTDYQAFYGGVVSVSSLFARRGLYGMRSTGDITYRLPQALVAGKTYAFSCDLLGQSRCRLQVSSQAPSNAVIAAIDVVGYKFWTRPFLRFTAPSSALVYLSVIKDTGASIQASGFQLNEERVSTYFSGNTSGFLLETVRPYGWLGNPHNSPSYRLASTRSGGVPIPLDDLGLEVISFNGLGLLEPELTISDYALRHGGHHESTRYGGREFQIIGQICASNRHDYLCRRGNLSHYLEPIFSQSRQPVRLLFQLQDCEEPLCEQIEMDALYASGHDLSYSGHYGERIALSFKMADPFLHTAGERTEQLDLTPVAATGASAVARDPFGNWQLLPGISAGIVWDITNGPDGLTYFSVQDVSLPNQTGYLWRWDGYTFTQVAAFDDRINEIVAAPDNNLYLAGRFTQRVGGAAGEFTGLARYNTITGTIDNISSTVFTPTGGAVRLFAGAYARSTGEVIVGGSFSAVGSTSSPTIAALNVAAYNVFTDTWRALGNGVGTAGDQVQAIAISPNDILFAGGRFDHASYHNLAKTSLSIVGGDWTFVDDPTTNGDPQDANVRVIRFDQAGRMYVGGRFNDSQNGNWTSVYAGSTQHPLTCVAYYDWADVLSVLPYALQPIGMGVMPGDAANSMSQVEDIAIDCVRGEVWVAGVFNSVANAQSNGSILTPTAITSPGIASFGQYDHAWRTAEIILPPSSAAPIPYPVNSIAFGRVCDSAGALQGFGAGSIQASTVSGFDLGVTPGYSGSLFVGYEITQANAQNAYIPVLTEIDTRCSVAAKPVLRFLGPGDLYSVTNQTTGKKLTFRPYKLVAGETLTIDLAAAIPSVYSTVNGDQSGALAADSDLANFELESGENNITVNLNNLVGGVRDSRTRAYITWRPSYTSIDVACCCEDYDEH